MPATEPAVAELQTLLVRAAPGFAARRPDVVTPEITWPRRGLHADEARAFLRAVGSGFATVDDSGYVRVLGARTARPESRYALFSRNGDGLAVNLEYLIQFGAAAELVLDHGWPADRLEVERGAFDALGTSDGRVTLAVEAKARVRGPDGLERLRRAWSSYRGRPVPDTNAGRKYAELLRLCVDGPVTVWLVAAGARWTFLATRDERGLVLTATGGAPRHGTTGVATGHRSRGVLWTQPWTRTLHARGTHGARGRCSWSCPEPAVASMLVRELGGSTSVFALCEQHREHVQDRYAA